MCVVVDSSEGRAIAQEATRESCFIFIIGSGRDALLCRYFTGRRPLDADDQLTLEFAGAYRRYHSCLKPASASLFIPRAPVA